MILTAPLIDGLFAAIAGIGFGAISDPPMRAFPNIAILSAIGHAIRFCLMNYLGIDIALASFVAALSIGMGSLPLGKIIKCPMTVLYIPALLPMVPGMYAYKILLSLTRFMQNMKDPVLGPRYIDDIMLNFTITVSVVFMLAIGATLPALIFKKRSMQVTRGRRFKS
jgi:uncharacterized membrane protein YjjB (DUF3815 family)